MNIGASIETGSAVEDAVQGFKANGGRKYSFVADNTVVAKVNNGTNEIVTEADPSTGAMTVKVDGTQVYPTP